MSRITATLAALREKKRKALIPFVTAGDPDTFQVSSTQGGAAIDLTTDGDNFVFWTPLPFDKWREWGARQVDSFLPIHVIPLAEPYPEIVVTANAELAAIPAAAMNMPRWAMYPP